MKADRAAVAWVCGDGGSRAVDNQRFVHERYKSCDRGCTGETCWSTMITTRRPTSVSRIGWWRIS